MGEKFTTAGLFLISTLFDMYILVLVIRLLLAYASANYFNPITQVIIKLTSPLVNPLRKIIPNYFRIEFSTLLLIFVFLLIKITLLSLLTVGMLKPLDLLILALFATIKFILQTLFYAILLQAILSWFPTGYSEASQILEQVTSPILKPIRRIIPPIQGMDISPIPALIILQLVIILLP
jgi:YggT family protein